MRRTWTWAGMMVLLLAATGLAQVNLTTKTVGYKQGDAALKGYLAYDASLEGKNERRPAVIVVHEWYGLNEYAKRRTRELAELGYVALAADIYGDGQSTADPAEAGKLAGQYRNDRPLLRARAQAALDLLRDHPLVDKDRIVCLGYCFGGMTSLELARSGAPIAGAVSIHGSFSTPDPSLLKTYKGKLLVLHGTDDPATPPAEVEGFEKELRESKIDYTLIYYGHQGHAFTNPDADKLGRPGIKYDAASDARSWRHLNLFLSEVLKHPYNAEQVEKVAGAAGR